MTPTRTETWLLDRDLETGRVAHMTKIADGDATPEPREEPRT